MAVFDRFMDIADEITGIPKYMTGQHVPGAGRTSSGLSMLISNAGKSIKQVIANIDHDVLTPMLERQYQRNLRYSQDPDLRGDVQIIAKGAMSLVVKEAESVRKTEFLRLVLESPVAQQIVGLPGTAELMRDLAGNLNGNIDRLVPSREDVEKQQQQQQMMQQQMMIIQYLMPFMLLVWFNNYSSGLSYYYFISNVLTFGQQWVIKEFVIDEKAIRAQIDETKAKGGSQSRFAKKMNEMLEANKEAGNRRARRGK